VPPIGTSAHVDQLIRILEKRRVDKRIVSIPSFFAAFRFLEYGDQSERRRRREDAQPDIIQKNSLRRFYPITLARKEVEFWFRFSVQPIHVRPIARPCKYNEYRMELWEQQRRQLTASPMHYYRKNRRTEPGALGESHRHPPIRGTRVRTEGWRFERNYS
jgi:hypothetical protein